MDIVIVALPYVEAFRQLGKKNKKEKNPKHLLEKAEQQTS